jgi:hypothetical protein
MFYRTFSLYGSAISHFPWAWNQVYTDPAAVQNLIFQGAAVWIIDVSVSALLLYIAIPKAISHRRAESEISEISVREAASFGFGIPTNSTLSTEPKEG